MIVQLKNDAGLVKQVKVGFSWSALLFGGLPFFFRGVHLYGGIWLVGMLLLAMVAAVASIPYEDTKAVGILSNIAMGVLMNKLTFQYYLKHGYKPVSEAWDMAVRKLRVGMGTYALIGFMGLIIFGILSAPSTEQNQAQDETEYLRILKAAEQGNANRNVSMSLGHLPLAFSVEHRLSES